MGLQYNIITQPQQIVYKDNNTGIYLTNTGLNTIYVGTDSAVTNQSQPIEVNGSLFFEPGIDIWAAVFDSNKAGNLTVTYGASDRFALNTPGNTLIATVSAVGITSLVD